MAKRKTMEQVAKRVVKNALETQAELKFHNYSIASQNIDSAGNLYDLSVIAQGLTDSNRVGDVIRPEEIELRMTVVPGSANTRSFLRVIIFQWKDLYEASLGLPTFNDILNSNYQSTVNTVNAPRNMDKKEAVRILVDRTYGVNYYSNDQKVIVKTAKIMRKIHYTAGSQYYGSGKIMMLLVSDDTSGLNAYRPTVSFVSQLTYTDS